jgi:hypothetical protein
MAAPAFDTHKAVRRLKDAGIEEPLAEAVVETVGEAISGNLATKDDLRNINADLRVIKAELEALELRIILKLGSLVILTMGLAVALIKLIP